MTQTTTTRSTCPYCGVGCGVLIQTQAGRITGVQGDPDHPANLGRLCSKGSTLHLTAAEHVTRQTRLLQPLRRPQRGAEPVAVGWDAALDEAAQRLAALHQAHGPDAIGVYVSGQLLTEDYYVFNKLVKGLLGSNHIDTNSRLCMSSAVAGYKATLGADAPPCSYTDLALAQTVFITGSNMAWAHPILFRRLEDARRANPAQKWIVADPRRTETAAAAVEAGGLHLALRPGSDIALYHGLLHLLLWEGFANAAFIAEHTRGFDALKDRVRDFTPRRTAELTGLREEDLLTAARWFGGATPTLSLYCQGLNQSREGTAKNAALINLHLATGQIGLPGAGPFSLTGQPNAMGGREVGGLANLLSAHRDLANPEHRAEVARLWGVPEVPARPGLTAVEMFQAAADGQLKALWIACTNPAQSLPDQATVRRALERAEFVIVQEAFATTATAAYADLLLPATTWGEKDGTVTNSERRISRVRPALPAAGQARHDWAIAADLARRLARHIAPERVAMFDYPTPEAVWREHRESTRGRDLDITGLSYAMLEQNGPQQWPLREGQHQGTERLYEDGHFATPDGRARFADVPFLGLAEPVDADYPVSLLTGRLRDQWHGMSRTGTLARLFGHEGEPVVDLHPQTLSRLGLEEGALVRVVSRRGQLVLPARAQEGVAPDQAFIAMHWGQEVLGGATENGQALLGVNGLTTPAFCDRSKQPELKHCAVRLEPAALPWRLTAMAWLPATRALALRERLKRAMPDFGWMSLVPFGREPDAAATDPDAARVGLLLRAGAHRPVGEALLATLRQALALDQPDVLAYRDPQRPGQPAERLLRLGRDAGGHEHLQAFWVAGDASGEAWLRALLQADEALPLPGRSLLAPQAQRLLGQGATVRSPQVCTCFDVREDRITAQLAQCAGDPAQRLAQLQTALRCGTNCGSCLPTLRGLVQRVPAAVGLTPAKSSTATRS
ncbi:nitrate reductase [Ideonella livida]|uniref:Nitrate reductase n=1 Tax=Ideonella livida TaxID=2707176 RepID=A0A7C9PIK5_9BURK|nr:nitrate reductase [Ideonella livida]NDY92728.1 nitrate reductase [Ideonella livida]